MLVAQGGDVDAEEVEGRSRELGPNPRPEWTTHTLAMISEGRMKRVRYWDARGQGPQEMRELEGEM